MFLGITSLLQSVVLIVQYFLYRHTHEGTRGDQGDHDNDHDCDRDGIKNKTRVDDQAAKGSSSSTGGRTSAVVAVAGFSELENGDEQ